MRLYDRFKRDHIVVLVAMGLFFELMQSWESLAQQRERAIFHACAE